MKIVVPQSVTDESLTTNVVNDVSDWSAGTYNLGDQAVEGEYIYEVVADPSTTDQPSVGAAKDTPTWTQLGRSNQWRMFRDGTDSVSSQQEEIDVTIATETAINAVAVLGAVGNSVTVTLTHDTEGEVYSEEKSLVDIGVDNWWQYFFLDYEVTTDLYFTGIPAYSGDLNIVIAAADASSDAECGRVVIGLEYDVGVTVENVQSRIEDFSRKERDSFGNLVLVPRRTIRIVDYDFMVEADLLASVQRRFRSVAAIPALFVGDDDLPETIVFGVFNQFSTIINGYTVSECAASIEEF